MKAAESTILVRRPEDIFLAHGELEHGGFEGRWHYSFDKYYDRDYTHFGTLRVFNDDTLSPGAVWPLHPHRNIEVVTYCASGFFRHADEHGEGGVLKPGWVQHTSAGRGMWHAEINASRVEPLRFIQMWFLPLEADLEPALQQKQVERVDRTGMLLPLVSNIHPEALPIASDAVVWASFLPARHTLSHELWVGHGAYLYVVEGGPVMVGNEKLSALAAAKIIGGDTSFEITAENDAELLMVEVPLATSNRMAL